MTVIEQTVDLLEKACAGAASLIQEYTGNKTEIEVLNLQFGNAMTLYLKKDGEIMYKRVWEVEDPTQTEETKMVLIGAMLVEMIATFCITVEQVKKQGKGV
jgi:hypothetical protein